MIQYYVERFSEDNGLLRQTIVLFKTLHIFDPYQAKSLQLDAQKNNQLSQYPVFEPQVQGLVAELPTYLNMLDKIESPVEDILKLFNL